MLGHIDLASMINGMQFEDYFLLRSAEVRSTLAGKVYVDIVLSDMSGSMPAKWWDGLAVPAEPGSVVKVRGAAQEYKGTLQIRIERIRKATEGDGVSPAQFVPSAPDDPEDMLLFIMERAEAIADPSLRAIVSALLGRETDVLLRAPAAANFHHSVRAGLLWHVSTMLRAADALCGVYPMLDPDLLAAGVIVHDLAKTRELCITDLGLAEDYTREGLLLGHIAIGVSDIAEAGRTVGASDETVLLLQHMVLSHHGIPEYGSPRAPMFPEAEALHHLDALDARMFDMDRALEATGDGKFSDRVRSLENRRLYRREGGPREA